VPKQHLVLNDFSGGLNTYQEYRDLQINELSECYNFTFQKGRTVRTRGSFETHGTAPQHAATISGGYGLASFESDYSSTEYEAVDTSQSTNIVFTDDSGDGGEAGSGTLVGRFLEAGNVVSSSHTSSGLKDTIDTSLVVGGQIAIRGTVKNNGIYTVGGIGDSINIDGVSNLNAIEIEFDSGSFASETIAANSTTNGTVSITSHALGENSLVLSDVANSELDVYNLSSDAFTAGRISTKTSGVISGAAGISPEYSFYIVDNVVRVSDGKDVPTLQKVKWYGYINRHHFRGVQHSSTDLRGDATVHKGWFSKDNTLAPPSSANNASRTDTANTYPSANVGFSIDYDSTNANENAFFETKTWKIAVSFVYDGNQESLLTIPTVNNTFTTVLGNDLRLRVMAKIGSSGTGYDARISGGRMYCKDNTDDTANWLLLANIDLVEGVSASLTGDKSSWVANSATEIYADIELINMNFDTFESINGYSPEISANSIGRLGEGWRTGVIANRRAFVANVKIKNAYDANITAYGDRIMFSLPNRFDTFPSFNFIDVVKGDAEAYLKLHSFADRLVALKHNSVQIINISSPSESGWFLEEDIKNNGVNHPAASFRSNKGILWANKKGLFIYTGSQIGNLIDKKIDQSEWSSFMTNFSIVGYDGNADMAIVIRDSENSAANQGDAYIYDFKTNAWSFHSDLLTASAGKYTNFVTDYNGDLVVGVQNSTNVDIKKFNYTRNAVVATDEAYFSTKDFDFGFPSLKKKIYAITVTYKSDAAQTNPISFALDGSTSFTEATGNFSNTSSWKRLRATLSSPQSCQSVRIRIKNNSSNTIDNDDGIQINDISVEYRLINKGRVVSD
jgi:hypothetical protein